LQNGEKKSIAQMAEKSFEKIGLKSILKRWTQLNAILNIILNPINSKHNCRKRKGRSGRNITAWNKWVS